MVVFPNAKINIGLFVTEKRGDGFHNLETVFYPIGLSDILEITRMDGKAGECSFHTSGLDVACDAGDNLVVKAWRMLAGDYGLPAVRIHLHKVIPFGAGLGGGSSDAAFMLKAVNEYFGLKLPEASLIDYAARLGSDCAFFIRNRPAFASGKGEVLEDMDLSLAGYDMVLVKPSFGVSTPEAYAGIVPKPAGFDLRGLRGLPVGEWKQRVRNDFEESVFVKYPRLSELKECLYSRGAVYASMTGSGSAVYGVFEKGSEVDLEFEGCFVWKSM